MRFVVPAITIVALLTAVAGAQDIEDKYEFVLLPVLINPNVPVPGAYGSLWTTELAITNTGNHPLYLADYILSGGPSVCGLCYFDDVDPQRTYYPIVWTAGRGHLLFFEKGRFGDLQIDLRAKDISRAHTSSGTRLPIVHQSRITNNAKHLLNVPNSADQRVVIRIYATELAPESRIQIQAFGIDPGRGSPRGQDEDELLSSQTIELEPGDSHTPHYAQINVAELLQTESASRVRIDIRTTDTDTRFWAFAAVTHNSTQHVTIIEPLQ